MKTLVSKTGIVRILENGTRKSTSPIGNATTKYSRLRVTAESRQRSPHAKWNMSDDTRSNKPNSTVVKACTGGAKSSGLEFTTTAVGLQL